MFIKIFIFTYCKPYFQHIPNPMDFTQCLSVTPDRLCKFFDLSLPFFYVWIFLEPLDLTLNLTLDLTLELTLDRTWI